MDLARLGFALLAVGRIHFAWRNASGGDPLYGALLLAGGAGFAFLAAAGAAFPKGDLSRWGGGLAASAAVASVLVNVVRFEATLYWAPLLLSAAAAVALAAAALRKADTPLATPALVVLAAANAMYIVLNATSSGLTLAVDGTFLLGGAGALLAARTLNARRSTAAAKPGPRGGPV